MDVIFQKPKFRKLKKQGLTYVDMHFHTNYSMDTSTRVTFIAKRAKMLGCGIAITDHNEIKGSFELAKKKKCMVIPSIEITSSELLDIIPYFYHQNDLKEFYSKHIKHYIRPNIGFNFNRVTWKFEEILNKLRNYRCIVNLPHPYAPYPQNTDQFLLKENKKLLNHIDSLEVLNGTLHRERNLNAIKLNKKLKKAYTGGSDGHTLFQLGEVITITENTDVEGFLNYIKKRQNIVMGEEMSFGHRSWVHLVIFKNALKFKIKEKGSKLAKKNGDN